LSCIYSGFPIIVVGPVYTNFDNLADGGILKATSGTNRGTHAYMVVGYDDSKNAFKFQNSWGTGWSSAGLGWIDYDYVSQWWKEAYMLVDQAGTVKDIEGNVYKTIPVGTQVWMTENLKSTKYNDGTSILNLTSVWSLLSIPGYCWYNNDGATYKTTYGALYNWFAVNTGKLCPAGWHVPTDAQWTILTNYLGVINTTNYSDAGGKLKETGTTHWQSPNTGATNKSGFTALPGGARYDNGAFSNIRTGGWWWSSTSSSANAFQRSMSSNSTYINRAASSKYTGLSVRCLKNN